MTCPKCGNPQVEKAAVCADCDATLGEVNEQIVSPDTIFPDEQIVPKKTPLPPDATDETVARVELRQVVEPTLVLDTLDELDPVATFDTRSFEAAAQTESTPFETAQTPEKPKKRVPVKAIVIAAAATAVLVAAVIAVVWFMTRDKALSYTAFVQDGQLYLLDTVSGATTLVDDDCAKAASVMMSADGKRLFYITAGDGDALMTCEVDDPKKALEKIAENVYRYAISDNGEALVFLSNTNELYYYDFAKKDKLGLVRNEAEDSIEIGSTYLAADGGAVLYRLADDTLYYKKRGENAVTVAPHVQQMYCKSGDLSLYYYLDRDGVLFQSKNGKVSRVDTEVQTVSVNADGTCYYQKDEEYTRPLSDFIIDDVTVTIPEEPTLPKETDFASRRDYEEARDEYARLKAEYDNAVDQAAVYDAVRAASSTYTFGRCAVYYFDGNAASCLARSLNKPAIFAEQASVAVYSAVSIENIGKAALSRLSSEAQLRDAIEAQVIRQTRLFAAVGGECRELGADAVQTDRTWLSADGQRLHVEDVQADSTTVYTVILDREGAVIGESVAEFEGVVVWNERTGLMCVSDPQTGHVTALYDGDKKIADNPGEVVDWDGDTKTALYLAEYNDETGRGALMRYTLGGEPEKIADDVREAVFDDGDRVTYLGDYRMDDETGDVYTVFDGRHEKICEDATGVADVEGADKYRY
ncbi:MAG: hypothetical protein IKV35_05605, partial [Clostridia bacterium]|nr:hypothetical protein [Clostridia bacterium]